MSATTQALLEQLEETKILISLRQLKGEDVTDLLVKVKDIQEKLLSANQTLNEAKQILKG